MKCCIKKFVLFALVFVFVFSVPVTSNAKKRHKEVAVEVDAIFTPDGASHNAEKFETVIKPSENHGKKKTKKTKKNHKNEKKSKKTKKNRKSKKK